MFFILDEPLRNTNKDLVAAGIQIGNTVASSYIVDAYPLQSTSVVTFYAVFLNLSAFINPVRELRNQQCKRFDSITNLLSFAVLYRSVGSICWLELDIHNASIDCCHLWRSGHGNAS